MHRNIFVFYDVRFKKRICLHTGIYSKQALAILTKCKCFSNYYSVFSIILGTRTCDPAH